MFNISSEIDYIKVQLVYPLHILYSLKLVYQTKMKIQILIFVLIIPFDVMALLEEKVETWLELLSVGVSEGRNNIDHWPSATAGVLTWYPNIPEPLILRDTNINCLTDMS